MEPTDAVRDPFPFSRSGLQVEPRLAADGSLGIRQVYVDSPAAKAGMSRGDALLAIDSRPVAALGVKGVRALLRQPPGVLVRLKVRQGTSAVEVEIELADLL